MRFISASLFSAALLFQNMLPATAAEREVVVQLGTPGLGGFGAPVTFPNIQNWNSVTVSLARGACFGTCPIYSVEVRGDGSVLYDGYDCVAVKGKRRSHIPTAGVIKLVDMFRADNFLSLRDKYVAPITDNPGYQISIAFDKTRKIVADYVGDQVGMPPIVTELEREIDRVAGTRTWVFATGRKCSFGLGAAVSHP